MNARIDSMGEAQSVMTMRIDALDDRMTTRIYRLFYTIIRHQASGGSIAVVAAILAQGFIGG